MMSAGIVCTCMGVFRLKCWYAGMYVIFIHSMLILYPSESKHNMYLNLSSRRVPIYVNQGMYGIYALKRNH